MPDKTETLQTQLDALKASLLAQDFDSLTPEGIQDMLRAFLSDELGLSTAEGSLLQIILAPALMCSGRACRRCARRCPSRL